MTKWTLAVGTAALALSAMALAGPGGGHGGGGHGGGGHALRGSGHGGGGGGHAMRSAHSARHQMHGSARHAERQAMRHERVGSHTERLSQRGSINGCPPGLAAKNNGCLPPGQVKQRWGYGAPLDARFANSYLPGLYRSWFPDTNQYSYRFGDGYAYRIDRSNNFVSGLFPLSSTGYYALGNQYPSAYDFYNVPQPYQSYYPNNGAYDYRYGDGAIYQVNRSNGLVGGIVALLTRGGTGSGGLGSFGGLGIGQPLPTGYDAYNVPFQYRDRYYDTANQNYRYADGNIYRVDPKTQVIQAIISALI